MGLRFSVTFHSPHRSAGPGYLLRLAFVLLLHLNPFDLSLSMRLVEGGWNRRASTILRSIDTSSLRYPRSSSKRGNSYYCIGWVPAFSQFAERLNAPANLFMSARKLDQSF